MINNARVPAQHYHCQCYHLRIRDLGPTRPSQVNINKMKYEPRTFALNILLTGGSIKSAHNNAV